MRHLIYDGFSTPLLRRRAILLGGIALAAGAGLFRAVASAQDARAIPDPREDPRAETGGLATAVLAGGCFWGVQGVFQHLGGVSSALSGYAGGEASAARYEAVSDGATGHAEAVKVTFDPSQVSYARILQVFFSVAHDPTQLNRQGPDHGTQYRSAIFPADAEQARIANAYIVQLDQAKIFPAPIVTRIETGRPFYPAEAYHQDYLSRHPTQPYIVVNDLPKVHALQRLFPDRYRQKPILVASE